MPDDDEWFAASRYERYLPDVSGIASLDLNWEHAISYGNDGRSFGLHSLYARGHSQYHFVAACVIPTLPPEQYPIALVREGPLRGVSRDSYSVDVFASTITTWLPCYLLHLVGGWLQSARWCTRVWGRQVLQRPPERSPAKEVVGKMVERLQQETEQFLADEAALRQALQSFAGPALESLLSTLMRLALTLARDKTVPEAAFWQPADLYHLIEGTSPLSQYRRLADSETTPLTKWRALIQAYPFYNKPLFHLFADYSKPQNIPVSYPVFASHPNHWQVSLRKRPAAELAAAVLQRRMALDSSDLFELSLLDKVARLLVAQSTMIEAPLLPLVQHIAHYGAQRYSLAAVFFEAGQRWEAHSATPEARLRALTCYENAIHWYALSSAEGWHWDALARVRALAAGQGDTSYLRHLEKMPRGPRRKGDGSSGRSA